MNDRLHSQLVAALLDAAVECWDVLLLSERVGLRKHHLDLTYVDLLKPPERDEINVETPISGFTTKSSIDVV